MDHLRFGEAAMMGPSINRGMDGVFRRAEPPRRQSHGRIKRDTFENHSFHCHPISRHRRYCGFGRSQAPRRRAGSSAGCQLRGGLQGGRIRRSRLGTVHHAVGPELRRIGESVRPGPPGTLGGSDQPKRRIGEDSRQPGRGAGRVPIRRQPRCMARRSLRGRRYGAQRLPGLRPGRRTRALREDEFWGGADGGLRWNADRPKARSARRRADRSGDTIAGRADVGPLCGNDGGGRRLWKRRPRSR